jgi:hypothetical protein
VVDLSIRTAFLTHFQKISVSIDKQLVKELKFNARVIISGTKSVKKGQEM